MKKSKQTKVKEDPKTNFKENKEDILIYLFCKLKFFLFLNFSV